jgi:hypothetical protein
MTSFRGSLVTGLFIGTLVAAGCGKTTRLGQVRPDTDGGGATNGEGGATASGGASGDTGASGGSATSGASGDAGASGASGVAGTSGVAGESGASGFAGTSGASAAGGASAGGTAGSTATDAGAGCHLLTPVPIPNPSPADLERASLIHDYCVVLVRDDCLDHIPGSSFIHEQARGCSTEGRITACEQDRLYEFVQSITPACDEPWRATIRCLAAQTFESGCGSASVFVVGTPCNAEQTALFKCVTDTTTWRTISGSRMSCDYGKGFFSDCAVNCAQGTNWFAGDCDAPAGLPLRCGCWVNNYAGGNLSGDDKGLYASDCHDAATRMANGEWCTDRLDCCLKYVEAGKERCLCGSSQGCAELAAGLGGTVVELCPQYEPRP